jgi:hypothetical protein
MDNLITINPAGTIIEMEINTDYVQPIKLTVEEAVQVAAALMECVKLVRPELALVD